MVSGIREKIVCAILALVSVAALSSCAAPVTRVDDGTSAEPTEAVFTPKTPTEEQISKKLSFYYYKNGKIIETDDYSLYEKMFTDHPNERVAVFLYHSDPSGWRRSEEYDPLKPFLTDYGMADFLTDVWTLHGESEDGYALSESSSMAEMIFKDYSTFIKYYDTVMSMIADDRIHEVRLWPDPYSEFYNTDDDTIDD